MAAVAASAVVRSIDPGLQVASLWPHRGQQAVPPGESAGMRCSRSQSGQATTSGDRVLMPTFYSTQPAEGRGKSMGCGPEVRTPSKRGRCVRGRDLDTAEAPGYFFAAGSTFTATASVYVITSRSPTLTSSSFSGRNGFTVTDFPSSPFRVAVFAFLSIAVIVALTLV